MTMVILLKVVGVIVLYLLVILGVMWLSAKLDKLSSQWDREWEAVEAVLIRMLPARLEEVKYRVLVTAHDDILIWRLRACEESWRKICAKDHSFRDVRWLVAELEDLSKEVLRACRNGPGGEF